MNAPCVLLPGVEMQGRAEIPQFWGESHWAQELETILPPLDFLGPETFLSPSIILHCTALQTPEWGASMWKWRKGEMRGSSLNSLWYHPRWRVTRALTACQHVPMKIDPDPMKIICKCIFHVDYTCQNPLNQNAAAYKFFIRITHILFNLALASSNWEDKEWDCFSTSHRWVWSGIVLPWKIHPTLRRLGIALASVLSG